ncbi:MAG: KpsF/GutQ family sugar-phosphate isomerase [Rickettsiaceae bacterium]|nr:KpsF/GutQ family sugar-phosphate isomerase [Rickettsiaceae bacterium]
MNYQEIASKVILKESDALQKLATNIPADFSKVIDHILRIKGRVICIGMGKSGHIAKKIAASLASTGTPAFFIHPGEASHGDLGMITKSDIVLMLSNSGETKELSDTINYCKRYDIPIVAMTMNNNSTLAVNSTYLLSIPASTEASIVAAPTTSTLMCLALGDALMVALHESKGFLQDDFKEFHPGGKIGKNLVKIHELMYNGDKLPLVKQHNLFSEVIIIITEKSLGCAIVIDDNNKLIGIVTDGDVRRHINDDLNKIKAIDVMTKNPVAITKEKLATEALHIMNNKAITALPVINDINEVIGIIHIHDILRNGIE